MGDKGGKKDKEKSKQQQAKKHQDDAQRKQDNAPRAKPGQVAAEGLRQRALIARERQPAEG